MDLMHIGENANSWPLGLLGGGEHFADIDGGQQKAARLGRTRIALCDINPMEPLVQGQQCYNMLSHGIFIGHIHSTNKSCSKILLLLVFNFYYHHPNHHHSPVHSLHFNYHHLNLQNMAWNCSSWHPFHIISIN